jgi:hypothetical protein
MIPNNFLTSAIRAYLQSGGDPIALTQMLEASNPEARPDAYEEGGDVLSQIEKRKKEGL